MLLSSKKNKLSASYLFLLTAVAGIAIFISTWNSYLQGKEKIFLSLAFLVLFLTGLLALYLHYSRFVSFLKSSNPSKDQQLTVTSPSQETQVIEINNGNETSIDLLKGAFSTPDVRIIGEKILKNLALEFEIVQGIFFVLNNETDKFTPAASYACNFERLSPDFALGEGITGQAVSDRKILEILNLPESYSPVISGLGKGKARYLYIIPLIHEKKSLAVIEISCFKEIEKNLMPLLNLMMREGGLKISSVLSPEIK